MKPRCLPVPAEVVVWEYARRQAISNLKTFAYSVKGRKTRRRESA